MKLYLTLFFTIYISVSVAQPNCNYFLHIGDSIKYEACRETEKAGKYYQFSRDFQMIMDNAIKIDPTFAYAYREKSVAYLKSGDFLEWKRLIDLAVKYDPLGNLGYRASCSHQFFKAYPSAIADIEALSKMTDADIGHSANGMYHLQIVRALCYSALGNKQKAIEIFEAMLAKEDYLVGIYDYIHLGVLYLETENLQKAKENFEKQVDYNNLAENHFYMAKVLIAQNKRGEAKLELEKATSLFQKGFVMSDGYVYLEDKIYSNMIAEMKKLLN